MKIRLDALDKLFSQFIRQRAIRLVHGCERCKAWKESYKKLDCSHFHKRRKQSTRYDEMNCNGFCFGCHQYFEENRDEYEWWLKNHIGEREFDLLNARVRIMGKPDKVAIAIYLKEKIKLLEGNNG